MRGVDKAAAHLLDLLAACTEVLRSVRDALEGVEFEIPWDDSEKMVNRIDALLEALKEANDASR